MNSVWLSMVVMSYTCHKQTCYGYNCAAGSSFQVGRSSTLDVSGIPMILEVNGGHGGCWENSWTPCSSYKVYVSSGKLQKYRYGNIHHILLGKLTISTAMFNSYVSHTNGYIYLYIYNCKPSSTINTSASILEMVCSSPFWTANQLYGKFCWSDWFEVTIEKRPMFQAYAREYPHKIWPHMVLTYEYQPILGSWRSPIYQLTKMWGLSIIWW